MMMIIRRIIAIPFFIVFFFLFSAILLLTTVYCAKNSEIYTSELVKTNIYDYIPKQLAKVVEIELIKGQNEKSTTTITTAIIYNVFSPEWLQKITEESFASFFPYIYGSKDTFQIRISLNDRIVSLGSELQAQLKNEKFSTFYQHMVALISKKIAENANSKDFAYIFGEKKTPKSFQKEISEILQTAYPIDKLRTELNKNISLITSFATKKEPECLLSLDTGSLCSAILDRVNIAFDRPDTHKKIIEFFLTSELFKQQFPYGIQFYKNDAEFLNQQIPFSWMQEKSKKLFGEMKSYFDGTRNDFQLDFSEYIRKLTFAFSVLAEKKLKHTWNSLEEGTPDETEKLMATIRSGQVPARRPFGMSIEDMLQETGNNISQVINEVFDAKGISLITSKDLFESVRSHSKEIFWDKSQMMKVLKVDFASIMQKFEQDINFSKNGEIIITEAIFSNDEENLKQIRLSMQYLPFVILLVAFISFIFLGFAGALCTKKGSSMIWMYILAILACIFFYSSTQVFNEVVWPEILKEYKKERSLASTLTEKTGEEVALRMLIAGKNTFYNNMRTYSFYVGVFCLLLLILKRMAIKSPKREHSDEQISLENNDELN